VREYFDREGRRSSQEIFSPDGHIAESIRYQQAGETVVESDHWWYDRGTPLRRLMKRGEEYVKQRDNWVRVEKK
jgi:hypothetical protein